MLGVSPSLAAAARRSPRGGGGAPHNRVMATRMTSTRFVGRAPELVELRAALAEALEERPSLAFVAGESGRGQDAPHLGARALRPGRRRARRGRRVRRAGRGRAAVRAARRRAAAARARRRPGARRALARRPREPRPPAARPRAVAPAATAARSPARRRACSRACSSCSTASAGEDGLLLTIEDLHWADRSTRAFLVYLASSPVPRARARGRQLPPRRAAPPPPAAPAAGRARARRPRAAASSCAR